MRVRRYLLLSLLLSFSAFSEDETCRDQDNIVITTTDIFDLTDPDTIWLHKLANMLNVVTKEATIANEIAFLRDKCHINDRDLAEVERHLRKLKYINEATAVRDSSGDIAITTSDKWTLMPTIDFGRKGGNNKFAIGIKDRNLLGFGIDTELEYFSDVQRSGYMLDTHFPLFTNSNIRGSITLSDTDDGSTQGFSLIRPFVSFDTDNAFTLSAFTGDQSQQYFLNGKDYYSLSYSEQLASISWGKRYSRNAHSVTRYTLGIDYEKRQFTAFTTNYSEQLTPDAANRTYLVPYIQLEYVEDDFRELNNVHVINQIEDFNLGWLLRSRLGINIASRDNEESTFVAGFYASKGTQLNTDTLLLTDADLISNVGGTSRSRFVLSLNNELFYTLSSKIGLYSGQHMKVSRNQFADQPIVIGEENGVRGYPLEFNRGSSAVSLTGEVRYYPDISIYHFFELGAAAFVDAGKVYGTDEFAPQANQWLTSVGIGARFYSRHASETKVIHLDVSFPLLNDENVNNVEFLVTAKSSF